MSSLRNATFCLNLTRRPDRRILAWTQFRRSGLHVERVDAPDAVTITEERGWRNKGNRGCALGHRMAWRMGRKLGLAGVTVFEDDVVLRPGFAEAVANLEPCGRWIWNLHPKKRKTSACSAPRLLCGKQDHDGVSRKRGNQTCSPNHPKRGQLLRSEATFPAWKRRGQWDRRRRCACRGRR
jgi:hypothetical protein